MSTTPEITDELHRRLAELAEKVATLHWDLGGLTYEMAIRDHFRLDVLVRKAAELQEADAELGEVERLVADADQGVGGQCRACGAPHSRGAAYCWRCGQPLMLQAQSTLVGAAVVPPPGAAAANGTPSAPPAARALSDQTTVPRPE
jgi:predicted transcriptional regulator